MPIDDFFYLGPTPMGYEFFPFPTFRLYISWAIWSVPIITSNRSYGMYWNSARTCRLTRGREFWFKCSKLWTICFASRPKLFSSVVSTVPGRQGFKNPCSALNGPRWQSLKFKSAWVWMNCVNPFFNLLNMAQRYFKCIDNCLLLIFNLINL